MRPIGHPVYRTIVLALGSLMLVTAPGSVVAADSDGDGLRDGFERRFGATSPERRDSDWDGVVDPAEDSDGDRLSDRAEQRFGTHPGRQDSDKDGRLDGAEDHDHDGRSNRSEQEQRPVPAGVQPPLKGAKRDRTRVSKRCVSPESSAGLLRCFEGDLDGERTVVLFGDSHASMLLDPIRRAAWREDWRVVSMLKGACLPIPGLMNVFHYQMDHGGTCRTWRRRALDRVASHPPDLLVVAANDDAALVDGSGRQLATWRRPAHWRRGLDRLVGELPRRTELLILGDVPDTWNQPVFCLKQHPADMSRCVSRRKPLARRPIEQVQRMVAADSGQHFGTLHDKICPTDPCPLVQGKTLVWRSHGHLSATFARRLTPSLRKLLLGALD